MVVEISAADVVEVVATGQSSILIPTSKIRELVLAQKPVDAPFGAFRVEVIDVCLENKVIIAKFECSGDITIALSAIPIPQAKAAVAANEILGRPVSIAPSFVVEAKLQPYLIAESQELFAPVSDFKIVEIRPLNGLPFGIGNLATGLISEVVGKTFSVTDSVVRNVSTAIGRTVATATRPIRSVATKVGRGLSRVVPKRLRRKKRIDSDEVVSGHSDTETATKQDVDKDDIGRFASLVSRLLNLYLEKRPVLVLPEEYNDIPIAGLVRKFEIEESGIRVFLDVNENPIWRRRRNWMLYSVIGTAGGVCTEWVLSGTFLWF